MNCNACGHRVNQIDGYVVGHNKLWYKCDPTLIIACDNCGHSFSFTESGQVRNLTKGEVEELTDGPYAAIRKENAEKAFSKLNNLGSYAWG